jgi:hypothetical protein
MYGLDSVTHYRYIPGDYKISRKERIHVNQMGFIGEEIAPKCDSIFRIAIAGASETSGSVDFSVYTSFPRELHRKFTEEKWNVEVINCGLDGSRGYDTYRMLENRVMPLEPDLILMNYSLPFFTINGARETYRDFTLVYLRDDTLCRRLAMERVDQYYDKIHYINVIYILNNSYMMRVPLKFLLKHYRDWLPEKDPSDRNMTIKSWVYMITERNVLWQRPYELAFTEEESFEMIKNMQQKLKNRNISFFLFAENDSGEKKRAAAENRLPLISINVAYEEDDYLYHDGHKNKKGTRKMAARLYEILTRHIIGAGYKKNP